MAGGEFNTGERVERAGTRILTMAANTINRHILRELSDGPLRLDPGGAEAKITPKGEELLFIAFVVERWLQNAPEEPLPFGSSEAKAAITALVDGWGTTMVHALATEPLKLSDLERLIGGLGRSALRRRLRRMEDSGLVEAHPGDSEGGFYLVTDWLREGIAPLSAAARWERRNAAEDTAPIDPLDVEAAFLLSLPLIELPSEPSGLCRLGVEMPEDKARPMAGAMVGMEGGILTTCTARLEGKPDAWATGPPSAWLDAVIETDTAGIQVSGDETLPRALLVGLHEALFGIRVQGT